MVERGVFRQIADVFTNFQRVFKHVVAGHGGPARVCWNETREDFHCGGFASPVWAEESHNFPTLNRKRDPSQSLRGAEAFRQIFDFDHSASLSGFFIGFFKK